MNACKKVFLVVFLSCFMATAIAETPSPIEQTRMVTNKVLSSLKQGDDTMRRDPSKVYAIMRKYLLPRVDTTMMSRSVLGRAGWAKATPSQREKFIELFSTLMTYTYSSALAKYSDQKINYFPIRGGYQGKVLVSVNCQIVKAGHPPINLTYNLTLHGKTWMVYDISVEGISLLESFRQQFTAILNNQGMDQLLDILAKHNEAIHRRNQEASNE